MKQRARSEMLSTANNTKWHELRQAMIELQSPPAFRCKDLGGHYTSPDREWFYHFSDGGYETMEWVDLLIEHEGQRAPVLLALKSIGLAGHATSDGFRVYGYIQTGQLVDYF